MLRVIKLETRECFSVIRPEAGEDRNFLLNRVLRTWRKRKEASADLRREADDEEQVTEPENESGESPEGTFQVPSNKAVNKPRSFRIARTALGFPEISFYNKSALSIQIYKIDVTGPFDEFEER
ncbi:MAG: hypothetical protein ABSG49_08895 [Methanoregula sp.]|jgi:hypothetical protein|uniref:hypothetical protein n=1 Tax=Methanoregula sp. TaxID=2052170 RepID=UPI003C2A248F